MLWGSDDIWILPFKLPPPTLSLPLSSVKLCLAARQQCAPIECGLWLLGGRQAAGVLSGRDILYAPEARY